MPSRKGRQTSSVTRRWMRAWSRPCAVCACWPWRAGRARCRSRFSTAWRAGSRNCRRSVSIAGFRRHPARTGRHRQDADPHHPLGAYLIDSAHSWSLAAGLLESLGTRAVSDYSAQLFGAPDDPMPGNGPTTREAARHFIQIAQELDRELMAPEEQVPVSATARMQLQNDLDAFLKARDHRGARSGSACQGGRWSAPHSLAYRRHVQRLRPRAAVSS